jgi:hypothetical protein
MKFVHFYVFYLTSRSSFLSRSVAVVSQMFRNLIQSFVYMYRSIILYLILLPKLNDYNTINEN